MPSAISRVPPRRDHTDRAAMMAHLFDGKPQDDETIRTNPKRRRQWKMAAFTAHGRVAIVVGARRMRRLRNRDTPANRQRPQIGKAPRRNQLRQIRSSRFQRNEDPLRRINVPITSI